MKPSSTLATAALSTLVLALSLTPAARADDEPAHKLGDHPAIVVQRLYKNAGYDYASKFYPHPAWLRLYAAQPRDEADSATAQSQAAPVPSEPPVARSSAVSPKVAVRSGG